MNDKDWERFEALKLELAKISVSFQLYSDCAKLHEIANEMDELRAKMLND